jgi:hypothetical protein
MAFWWSKNPEDVFQRRRAIIYFTHQKALAAIDASEIKRSYEVSRALVREIYYRPEL